MLEEEDSSAGYPVCLKRGMARGTGAVSAKCSLGYLGEYL